MTEQNSEKLTVEVRRAKLTDPGWQYRLMFGDNEVLRNGSWKTRTEAAQAGYGALEQIDETELNWRRVARR